MANLSSPPYVQFIFILLFRGFPVHWVVEIHAFGVLPFPVPPDQVATHAQQGYYRWRERHSTLDLWQAPTRCSDVTAFFATSPALLPLVSQSVSEPFSHIFLH